MGMLNVQLAEGKTSFRTAEEIVGSVAWELEEAAEVVDVRLAWCTRGKGGVDEEVVEQLRIATPGAKGQASFKFIAPRSPVSFSGKIVSVLWLVTAVTMPKGQQVQMPITISPTGKEIDLYGSR
jgi:hypothetical protein